MVGLCLPCAHATPGGGLFTISHQFGWGYAMDISVNPLITNQKVG